MRVLVLSALAALPFVAAAQPSTPASGEAQTSADGQPGTTVTTASGLQYIDHVVGTGAQPRTGQTVSVLYTGTLDNGTVFDASSRHGNTPIQFPLGQGNVIRGWDEGIASMHVGGKRTLIIPPSLGYGAGDHGPIPGNSRLTFEVELVGVQ